MFFLGLPRLRRKCKAAFRVLQGRPSRRKEAFTLARHAALIADRNVTSSGQAERVGRIRGETSIVEQRVHAFVGAGAAPPGARDAQGRQTKSPREGVGQERLGASAQGDDGRP